RIPHRPFLLRTEVGRIDDEHLHRLATPALNGDLPHFPRGVSGEQRAVQRLDAALTASISTARENSGRRPNRCAIECEHRTIARLCETTDGAARNEQRRDSRIDSQERE